IGAGSSQRAGAVAGASAPPTPPQEQKQPCIRRGRFATGASGATAAGRACGAASEAARKAQAGSPAPRRAPWRAPGRTAESGTEEEEVLPEGLGDGSAAGQQHFSSATGQAQGETEGAQGVCGSDGPQLPPGKRQHSRRPSLTHPYPNEGPKKLSGREGATAYGRSARGRSRAHLLLH